MGGKSRNLAGMGMILRRRPESGGAGSPRVSIGLRRGWLLAAAIAVTLVAGFGVAQTTSQLRQSALDTIRRLDLQPELPRDPEPAETPPFADVQLPPELLWLPVIGGTAVLVYHFGTLLRFRRIGARASWDETSPIYQTSANSPTDSLAAATELARQGRFGEAMHLILLQALIAVRQAPGEEIADSLTSREILRNSRLSNPARAALREIVARVERSHFGHYPASPDDYAACRDALSEFMRTLHREQIA